MEIRKALELFKKNIPTLIDELFWAKFTDKSCLEEKVNCEEAVCNAFVLFQEDIETRVMLDDDLLRSYEERIRKSKKRWYNAEEKEGSSLYKEVWIGAKAVLDAPDGRRAFKNFYFVDTLQELETSILNDLSKWVSDKDNPLSNFRYIKDKNPTTIRKALLNDLQLFFYKEFERFYEEVKGPPLSTMPEFLIDGSVPVTAGKAVVDFFSKDIEVIEEKGDDGENLLKIKYVIDNDTYFQSMYDIDALKDVVFQSFNRYALRDFDMKILDGLLSFAEKDFFQSRTVTVRVHQLLKRLEMAPSETNYLNVYDSLQRMYSLKITIADKNSKTNLNFQIINEFSIYDIKRVFVAPEKRTPEYNELAQKVTVVAEINNEIVNQLIRDRTINMYREKLNALKSDSHKFLLLRLERERINLFYQYNTTGIFDTDINFFRKVFIFTGKRTSRHMKIIEKALDEIKANNITLKDYIRNGDYFRLIFHPINKKELTELSIDSNRKALGR